MEKTASIENQEIPVSQTASEPVSSKPKMNLKVIIIALAILLVGGVGYLAANFLNTPIKVKEKVNTVYPVFKDLDKKLGELVDEMNKETDDSDSDSLERSTKKTEGIVKDAEEKVKSLEELRNTLNIGPLKVFNVALDEYIIQAKELIALGKENVKLGQVWVEPMKDYEKLTIELSGVSNYLYSDPDKYITKLNEGIAEEKEIMKTVQNLEFQKEVKDLNEAMAKNLSIEIVFLEDMVKAVEERDNNKIALAQKVYAEDLQNNLKEVNRLTEKLEDLTKELTDKLNESFDKAETEYNVLKAKYKF